MYVHMFLWMVGFVNQFSSTFPYITPTPANQGTFFFSFWELDNETGACSYDRCKSSYFFLSLLSLATRGLCLLGISQVLLVLLMFRNVCQQRFKPWSGEIMQKLNLTCRWPLFSLRTLHVYPRPRSSSNTLPVRLRSLESALPWQSYLEVHLHAILTSGIKFQNSLYFLNVFREFIVSPHRILLLYSCWVFCPIAN